MRLDGLAWRAIHDVLSVARDPLTAAYRVSLADGRWINYRPHKRTAGVLDEAVLEPGHFGDVIDPLALTDSVLVYDVTFSAGVETVPNGWRFAGITDTELGLFVGDLQARFPRKVDLTTQAVTIDATEAIAAAREEAAVVPEPPAPAPRPLLNLDPTPVLSSATARHMKEANFIDGEQNAWDAATQAATSTSQTADTVQMLGYTEVVFATIYNASCQRSCLRFNTSAIAAVSALELVMNRSAGGGGPFGLATATFSATLTTSTNFAAIRTAYLANHIGTFTRSGPGENIFTSPDFADKFAQTSSFDVATYLDRDRTGTIPGDPGYSATFTATGASRPYLNITEVTGGMPPHLLTSMNPAAGGL